MKITHYQYLKALELINNYQVQEKEKIEKQAIAIWRENDEVYLNLSFYKDKSARLRNLLIIALREVNIEMDYYKIKRSDILKIELEKVFKYRNIGRTTLKTFLCLREELTKF